MALVEGPAWSARGLDQRSGRYPLAVEGPVLRAVDILVPGVSSVTRYVRHYALYAAMAAHAEEQELDSEDCRRLLRRSEVILAAASQADGVAGSAHGIDRVKELFLSSAGGLDVKGAADPDSMRKSYSPRAWGFWEQYGGPSQVLGTVALDGRALRPGRHACPLEVRRLFASLFAAASHDRLSAADLSDLAPISLQAENRAEVPWLRELFTAVSRGRHEPNDWQTDDRRRRSALRIHARTLDLGAAPGDPTPISAWEQTIAYGHLARTDPVLSRIPEVPGWRGVLLRNHSVSAWRRLWAAMIASIGQDGGDSDKSGEELRAWLADQMPAESVRSFLSGLPATMAGGETAPAEREILAADPSMSPLTAVGLLLLGGRRAEELEGEVRTAFLGAQRDFLNPLWVSLQTRDHLDRPMAELAERLVDDMLAQARRVAMSKMRPDREGRMLMFSRVHERNGRYYKTSDEGSTELGTRIPQLADFSVQLGLVDNVEGGTAAVTDEGRSMLDVFV
ncbi:hypothetical protein GCM10022221_13450 [Actinocorallia aurea]